MADPFQYDVFLSHSAKNKGVVRAIAERLKSDGIRVWFDEWEIRPGDSIPAKIEEGLERSRVLVLCMSAEAFGSDWAQLESHTFRFKDPLNQERRFIPLRLDETPARGSLDQFSYIDWREGSSRKNEYERLLRACRAIEVLQQPPQGSETLAARNPVDLGLRSRTDSYSFDPKGQFALTGSADEGVRCWDLKSGRCLYELKESHSNLNVNGSVVLSPDLRLAASASDRLVRLWDVKNGQEVRDLTGHSGAAMSVAWSPEGHYLASGDMGGQIRLWDLALGKSYRTLKGRQSQIRSLAWNSQGSRLASGDVGTRSIWIWDVGYGRRLLTLVGHTNFITGLAWFKDDRFLLSASYDGTLRMWDTESGACVRVLEGHTGSVWGVALSPNGRLALSGSTDGTVKLWDLENGSCVKSLAHSGSVSSVGFSSDGRIGFSGGREHPGVCFWDLSRFVRGELPSHSTKPPRRQRRLASQMHPAGSKTPHTEDQVQYTNAKVLLVGNSSAGKTGLSNRLALETYKETDSTVGAWATQWKLPIESKGGVEREVWLWDFGGQADQRLIHQLYMDQTQVAALVFDPQKDDLFETLGQWDRDLSRADKEKPDHERMIKILVAGRCDAGGLRVARRQVDRFVEERGYAAYLETSAKTNDGCQELKQAILEGIRWDHIPWRSSPVLFKRLKEKIVQLKDEGRVLMRFKELREVLSLRMSQSDPGEHFSDAELKAVLGLLAGPGVVWELEFGSWVLLQPERINAYAQAVIATIREDEFDRGCILEEQVLKGDLTYHASIARLPSDEEQFVLLAMHQILVERGLCYRHMIDTGQILLIFPSYYRRERPEMETAPAVQVSYEFNGFLDEIYATLVVKLHHTKEFHHDQLWRYAADFKTRDEQQLGVSLTRHAEGAGELAVYFGPKVPTGERILFSKYIHEHLLQAANEVVRLRHYICPHCGTPVGNRQVAMRKLEQGKQDIPCVECDAPDKRVPLWDELEDLFADPATKLRVQELRSDVEIVLDTTSKERVLVGEVISTVALAGQLCEEFTVTDQGIDMEITFRNDAGEATGRKVYLQLKSGDSYLKTRKRDGAEIFRSFNKRQAELWMDQRFPVILVIRNSSGEVRWMEIRDHLREITNQGQKQIRQIEFAGKRFDVMSVRRWRDRALAN